MRPFKAHSVESAPQESKPMLEASQQAFGMLPNLHAVMAESPALLEAYKTMHETFATKTAFNAEEQTVVWQSINVENECHYCVPAHTAIANGMKIDAAITDALRNNTALPNAKLEALRETTLAIIRNQGNVSQEQLNKFYEAGYSNQSYLDILVGYSQKIMSNYTNHIAKTEVDAPFQPFAWNKQATPAQ